MSKNLFFKFSVILVIATILYFGRVLLVPVIVAALLAILVYPILNWTKSKQWPSWVGVTMASLTLFFVVVLVGGVVVWQISLASQDSEEIKSELKSQIEKTDQWVQNSLGISEAQIKSVKTDLKENLKTFGKSFLGSFTSAMGTLLLIFVYVILFLMQHNRFERFIKNVTDKKGEKGKELIHHSAEIVRNYFMGKLLVMGILAVFYGIGFSIAGVAYAPMLAVIGALLTIIPYIGNIISALLVVVFTIIGGGDIVNIFIVLGIMGLAQVFESYVLLPKVMGDKIELNPFAVIFGIVAFGTIWGIMGTIVALPILGIAKVWFKAYPALTPYADLIEDNADD